MKRFASHSFIPATVLLLSFSFVTTARTGWDDMNYKSKVESASEVTYAAVTTGKEITKGAVGDSDYVEFDSNGNLLVDYHYLHDGSLWSVFTYKYDTANHVIEERGNNAKTVYKYDAQGNNTERTYSYSSDIPDGKSILKYDAKGNLLENDSYDDKGKLSDKHTYTYDDMGNCTECKHFGPNGNLIVRSTYSYDDHQNIIEQDDYSGDNILQTKTYSAYDDKKNVVSEKRDDANGKTIWTDAYTYEFDAKGNWVKKNYSQNGAARTISYRMISYY
jgi:YD repeat-containing protein